MTNRCAIDASVIEALFVEHGAEVRRFVLGVVNDHELAGDVLQATFVKAVELGHTARAETLKGWLFRVAYREALTARRRRVTHERSLRKLASRGQADATPPDEGLVRVETVGAVRDALGKLPVEQRMVVWARIYEDKSFAVIAAESGLPLGTVLTRMRLALEKLRRSLRPDRECD